MKLWHKVTLGLIAGVICGLVLKEKVIYVKFIGDIFINMIKMIIVPLIFFSLVSGITSMRDPSSIGRLGIKALSAFILTTSFAIVIGICIATLLKPGVGVVINFASDQLGGEIQHKVAQFNIADFVIRIVPSNAISAFASGEMIQVVFFALFTGITINMMGADNKKIIDLFQIFTKLVFKMISVIMELSPYGAFALTAWVVGTQGIEVMNSLGKLVFAMIVAMIIQYMIFGVIILLFARISPMPFYKKSFEYQALAFSTSSSKATLPTTMKICSEKLGISYTSTSFVLPLGASINMDGMAIYLGMCAIFFAQALGATLSFNDYVMIIFTATLGSIGGAGIPGGSMVMLPLVLSSINLPIEGVALIAGIDRILDMIRTTVNITGDAAVTLIVDKSEGNLDEEVYFS